MRDLFKKCLNADAMGDQQPGLGVDGAGDTLSQGGAHLHREVEAAGKEAFQHFKVCNAELLHGGHWQFYECRSRRMGLLGEWRFKQTRGKGAMAAGGVRFVEALTLVNNDGSSGKIAETLMLFGEEDAHGANHVDRRNLVDEAEEVARHGFEEPDAAAGSLDDPDLGDSLAGRAAIPECLKEREVTPAKEEWNEDEEGDLPLLSDFAEVRQTWVENGEQDDGEYDDGEPDQVIDEQGDEAAAQGSDRHIDCDEFGGLNAKLVPLRLTIWNQ